MVNSMGKTMYKVKHIDLDLIAKLIRYDSASGKLYWREREVPSGAGRHAAISFNKRRAGMEINPKPHPNGHGNLYKKLKVYGESYLYHRVCWAIAHNEQPLFIDHINGDGTDNRLCNLRSVTPTENNRNQRKNKLNTSGYMGVNKARFDSERWAAYIWIGNKQINLGVFDTKPEAVAARRAAEKIENYHANHGVR